MMKSCEELLQYFHSISEKKDFHFTYIINCIINDIISAIISYAAIMLNILTIYAIRKTPSLPKTLKTLLLSLAVSDVGVGLVVQPFYTALLVKWLQNNCSCSGNEAFHIILFLFSIASFSGVVAVSVDRFLAIHLHLRYRELVTHKRVVTVVISIWVLSAFLSIIVLWVPPDIYFAIIHILAFVCLVLTTLVYIRLYLAVQQHKNQMQALQVQQEAQNDEIANFASLIKSAFGTFYVYFLFLVCYLPHLISMAAIEMNGPSIALKKLFLYSMTLVFFNSALNPVIYCWKMRHIRHAIMDILRNMSWIRNHTSH